MPKIFISYRRDDSQGYAGRIHEQLSSAFGSESVFMDLDDIPPGANFVQSIENNIAAAEVMLVLIARNWLDARDPSGRRRIDDAEDFVHLEIAEALENKVRIIPILLNNAVMPGESNLPPRLRPLARFQAIRLSDERWDYDTSQLLKVLGGKPGNSRRRALQAGAGAAALLLVALLFTFLLADRSSSNIAGQWAADVRYDFGETHSEEFDFIVEGKVVSGTASFLDLDRPILDGKIEANQIEFTTISEEMEAGERRESSHRYRGSVENDTIRFVMQTEGGFSTHDPIEFVARRARID